MSGRLIAVVGPSGVGKDSVMAGLHARLPKTHLVRRVITRNRDAGGEAFDAVTDDVFDALARDGAFALRWRAHGLSYGIPTSLHDQLRHGTDCLANLSRTVLADAARLCPALVVLNITATPRTLAQRLGARGRETEADIARRLAEADKPLPAGLDIRHVSNDGALDDTVAHAVELLSAPPGATTTRRHANGGTRPESEMTQ